MLFNYSYWYHKKKNYKNNEEKNNKNNEEKNNKNNEEQNNKKKSLYRLFKKSRINIVKSKRLGIKGRLVYGNDRLLDRLISLVKWKYLNNKLSDKRKLEELHRNNPRNIIINLKVLILKLSSEIAYRRLLYIDKKYCNYKLTEDYLINNIHLLEDYPVVQNIFLIKYMNCSINDYLNPKPNFFWL